MRGSRAATPYLIVDRVLGVSVRNAYGYFEIGAYVLDGPRGRSEHLLLYRNLDADVCTLRLNSACFTGDLVGCGRCDCSWQFHFAMQYIATAGQGLVIYHLDHEARGNGLTAKLRSFRRDLGHDLESRYHDLPDQRTFGDGLAILEDLGICAVNLITNNPAKRRALEDRGIRVESIIPVVSSGPMLKAYNEFKKTRLGHWMGE